MVYEKATLCFAMRERFKLYNYRFDCALNIEDATTLLNTSSYVVVIADLDLGGTHNLDGLKVIQLVQEKFPETRIIVLTANGSAEIEATTRDCGVSAFLHKPKPLSEVARIVFELVGDKW